MEQDQLPKTNFFTKEEWDLTPEGVKQFLVQQEQKIEQLKNQQEELKKIIENLQEKVNCNSKNSSIPPSTEIFKPEKKKASKKKKRSRGGQKGHLGSSRKLYPESQCKSIENHKPEACKCCGEKLSGIDSNPYRHQIVEIPSIELEIVEHRLHQLECNHCGAKTRAKLPENISAHWLWSNNRSSGVVNEWGVSSFSSNGSQCHVGLFWGENVVGHSKSSPKRSQCSIIIRSG